jgi:DNA polymerase
VAVQKIRGTLLTLEDGAKILVTTHPSSLLRIPDREDRHLQYKAFVKDLRRCASYLSAT